MPKELYFKESLEGLNELVDGIPNVQKLHSYKIPQTCKSTKSVFDKAEYYDKLGDEELAYVYYMRFYKLVFLVRKFTKYKAEANYHDGLIGIKNAKSAIDRASELQASLKERYNQRSISVDSINHKNEVRNNDSVVTKNDHTESDKGSSIDTDDLNDLLPPTSKTPSLEPLTKKDRASEVRKLESAESGLKFMELKTLREFMITSQSKALVLDIRSSNHYQTSRMLHDLCINIPESIIEPGITTSGHIAKFLTDETDINIWSKRSEYDYIIVMDWNTNSSLRHDNQKLAALIDIIYKFDSYATLQREPRVLDGGYERWMLNYPSFCSNFNVIQVYVEEDPTKMSHSLFELDYPSLPWEEHTTETTEIELIDETTTDYSTRESTKDESADSTPVTVKSEVKPTADVDMDKTKSVDQNKVPQRPVKPEKFSSAKIDGEILENSKPSNTDENHEPIQHQMMKALESHHTKRREEIADRYEVELKNLQKQIEQQTDREKALLEKLKQSQDTIENQQNTIDGHVLLKKQMEEQLLKKEKELLDSESLKSKQSSITPTSQDLEKKNISDTKTANELENKNSNDKLRKNEETVNEDKKKPEIELVNRAVIKQNIEEENKKQAELEATKRQQEASRKALEAVKMELLKKQQEELELQKKKQEEEQRRLSRQLEQEKKIQLQLKERQIVTEEQQQKILKEERKVLNDRADNKSRLSEGWERILDEQTGRICYLNRKTKTRQWEPPVQSKSNRTIGLNTVNTKPSIDRGLKATPSIKSSGPPSVNRGSKPTECVITPAKLLRLAPVLGSEGYALTGLRNLGNTCYMNSILQCLINSVPLTKYFLTSTYRTDLNRENPLGMHGEVAEEFATIVHASWCGEYRYISPTDFKLTMSKFADRFAGNSQHDSQELLMILLDGLHEDINRVKQKDYIEDDDTSHLPDEEAANIAWDRHKRRNQSIIVELFQGQFKSTLVCLTCNKRSVTFQVFMNLSVPLPSHRSHCTLNDCLELFSKAERVQGDNKWFCSKCKCYREAMKKLEIWKLPPVLLIHFKRFSGTGLYWQKADTAVNFPVNGLTLKNQTVGPKHRHYNLYAVSNHYGTLEGGHYTAFCQNPYAKGWYKFDDHIVSRISSNDVKTSSAYILFYTSLNIPPLKLKKFSS